jgi:hypothetical protein
VRNDKKKWVDRLTGKEVNFKKYLECKFFLNGEELDKNITIYEIFTKYKGINNKYSGAFGDLGVEYKLALKKMETFEFSSGSRDQYKQPSMICLDHKSILQNLANRISSLDLKSTETSSVKEIIQMIIFIHELVDLDRRILSPATVLNTLLIDLKNRYGLEDLITAYREESVHLIRKELIPKNEFVNKKISLVTYKYLNVLTINYFIQFFFRILLHLQVARYLIYSGKSVRKLHLFWTLKASITITRMDVSISVVLCITFAKQTKQDLRT